MISVAEIFQGMDGEVNYFHQGRQTVFLRLAGCNLDPFCPYCDTKLYQSKDSGKVYSIKELAIEFDKYEGSNLTITGGEPLMQRHELYQLLLLDEMDRWKRISIETNGSLPLPEWRSIDDRIFSFVIDVKLTDPQFNFMEPDNWKYARCSDIFKMVVNRENCKRAIDIYKIIRQRNQSNPVISFSPEWTGYFPEYRNRVRYLMDTLQKANIYDAVINLQLHKILDVK